MTISFSPLRYPGGKSKIYNKVRGLIVANSLEDRTYVEPFAGGFGIGIRLLQDGIVPKAILNDLDFHIYNFWYSVLYKTDDLLKRISDTPITLDEREKQKKIYHNSSGSDCPVDEVSDGFATLFLNRVNYSGIITGGPLGGLSQTSRYKIDCRFNKEDIIEKIKGVALLKHRIKLYNYDASELITDILQDTSATSFFNIDPPYVKKGRHLYANYFREEDHIGLGKVITDHLSETNWIVTYDDCDLIRDIYKDYHMVEYGIRHDAGGSVRGKEIVISNIAQDSFNW